MTNSIRIDPKFQPAVQQALTDTLGLPAAQTTSIVSDGKLQKGDFFDTRDFQAKFPARSWIAKTIAMKLLDDHFFKEVDLGRGFYEALYEETAGKAADGSGADDETIDSQPEVDDFRRHLTSFVQEQQPEKLKDVRKALKKVAEQFLAKSDVSVSEEPGDIIRSRFTKSGPFSVDGLKQLFWDQAATSLPKVATKLFAKNQKIELPALDLKTANRPENSQLVVVGGMVVESELNAGLIPNKRAYIHMTLEEGNTATGKRRYVVHMKQLNPEQEKLYRLPPLENRMGSLKGDMIFEELPDGQTSVQMDVRANPNEPIIPDVFISSFWVGFPGLLLDAARQIAVHLAEKEIYEKCLKARNPICADDQGVRLRAK